MRGYKERGGGEMKKLVLAVTHLGAVLFGFALGIYLLPILIAPDTPDIAAVERAQVNGPRYEAQFDKDRKDSDTFHWGEGVIKVFDDTIVFEGEMAPGPDYRLYLTPEYVETEDAFWRIKDQSTQAGSIKTFDGFVLENVSAIENAEYNSVVVWCERFSQFITSAKLR